jgi:hypothetical protein
MGMGKSSGNQKTEVILTPEQRETLRIQNDALKNTFLPAYQNTVTGAKDVYNQTAPAAVGAAQTASDVAAGTGALQAGVGGGNLVTGSEGLKALFDPQYEQQQVDAALQAGRESGRETLGTQNAMYGAAGGLGSSRQALADRSLRSLIEQRQATAAAGARAGVQANKASASGALINAGQTGLTAANQAAAARIGYAGTPQDIYQKYASVVFGTPQASTTPNFAGTQGSNTAGSSKSAKLNFQ